MNRPRAAKLPPLPAGASFADADANSGLPPLPAGATFVDGPPLPLSGGLEGATPPLPPGASFVTGPDWTGGASTLAPPAARTATGADVLGAYAPGFVARHPAIAGGLGAGLNAIQGGGREALSQLNRLVGYISPRGGAAMHRALGDYEAPIDAAGEGSGRLGYDLLEMLAAPSGEAEGAAALPSFARLGLRMVRPALATGAVSALQGGSPWLGAAAGAGGEAIGALGNAVAPRILEHALRLKPGLGAGRAVLDEGLPGFGARRIARAAERRAEARGAELAAMLERADASGVRVPVVPARDEIRLGIEQARLRNNPAEVARLESLAGQLTARANGLIPSEVGPVEARALKQGVRESVGSNYGAQPGGVTGAARRVAKRAARALDRATDERIPGHAELNDRLSGLIAATKAKPRGGGVLMRSLRWSGPGLAGYESARALGANEREAAQIGLALGAAGELGSLAPVQVGAAKMLNSLAPVVLPRVALGAANATKSRSR